MIPAVPICCRCDWSIQPGQGVAKHVHDRPSGPPVVEFSHAYGCPLYPPREALRSASTGAG
jgi:hypothetical protein